MTLLRRLVLAVVLALPAVVPLVMPTAAWAVRPDEMLKDPAQEARARHISEGLRCLVCRNESIDDSNAALAHDLRVLVRERVTAGDSDSQVMNYLVSRYGEYVLLKPTTRGANLILWGAGPAMLIMALLIALLYQRRRNATRDARPGLSAEEEARIAELMKE